MFLQKLRSLAELEGKKGILCHGCFDILHIGHIRHLAMARNVDLYGPLIVTLTADRFIKKGPGRPCFNQLIRAECVASLAMVDYVAIVEEATGLAAIEAIRPLYYVKGREYEGRTGVAEMEQAYVRLYGGMVVFTDVIMSSTRILELLNGCQTRT